MNQENYTIPEDFKKIANIINPDSFVADMFKIGEIKKISKNYSDNVSLLCNNAIAWIIGKLKETSYIYEVEIIEGHFNNWGHTWIRAGDYYLDITLAQFLDCPKLVVSKIGSIKGYKQERVYDPFKWAKKTCKEMGII